MVPRAGFEPATYPLGGDRAIQLCHRGMINIYKQTYIIILKSMTLLALNTELSRGKIFELRS